MSRLKFRMFFLFLIIYNSAVCQSIRKNHKEMTPSEKDALVNAFYELDDGLVSDLAAFHNNNFGNIHFNLPDDPQDDVFFAWHRRQIFELEQAMQDLNPKISMPFWDWICTPANKFLDTPRRRCSTSATTTESPALR